MATLVELENDGQLYRINPQLGLRQQELRCIYVLPELQQWLQETLPGLGSSWFIEQSPIEQLDALIEVFCSGETLTFSRQFKPLTAIGDGIWELKTADLRVFGWFPQKDYFIWTDANLTGLIKSLHLYKPYSEQAVRRLNSLDLNKPKFIEGSDPDAVVSNYD